MGITENDRPIITAEQFLALTSSEETRAELINGEIVMYGAPDERHHDIVTEIFSAFRSFIRKEGGECKSFIAPFDVVLSERDVVQPDVFILCDRTKSDGKRICGAPDLVVEVVSSNRSDDYNRKLQMYMKSGVREYWIVDPSEKRIIVYLFGETIHIDFYDIDKPVPVGIWDGRLRIDLSELLG